VSYRRTLQEKQIAHICRFPINFKKATNAGGRSIDEYFARYDDGHSFYEKLCCDMGIQPLPELLVSTQSGEIPAVNDLGLHALTDDQLLNLMQQGWNEIGSRTEGLWNYWIATKERVEAEFKMRHDAWLEGIERAKKQRAADFTKEVEAKIRGLASQGLLPLLDASEEATLINVTTANVKLALLEDFAAKLQSGQSAKLSLQIEEGVASVTYDGKTVESVVPPAMADIFVGNIRKLVGV
jgi:hypothetical protein